ncbi:DNA-binding protein [Pseudodesulfovibrio cashew]|uniref:DNA-binding protein n=1 Tax=Pseudodesulfovibrio cashew TaxID=2678688 RepID=A0A6I6JE84_9BACT|nr:DNA-binding protein [Pseudodesulfovibrio cashew]QGY38742.1 DNA-binding protein [Pseudodesulfovibrio cashew]
MKFKDEIKKQGYVRYKGAVDASVYEYFNCDCSWKAVWYLKDGHYQCCGCKEKCETSDPDGFQLFLDLGE